MKADYYEELTDKTLEELTSFAGWVNKHFGHEPLIIGGWAVWVYVKGLGSRDIDAVFTEPKTKILALKTFFETHGWHQLSEIKRNEFGKQVRTARGVETVTLDVLTRSDVFKVDNLNIRAPMALALENSKRIDLGKAAIYVPVPELLVVYKIIAELGRRQMLKTAIGERSRKLESKTWKDCYDVASLLAKTQLDKQKLKTFQEKTGLQKHLNRFIEDLNGYTEILEEFAVNTGETRRQLLLG